MHASRPNLIHCRAVAQHSARVVMGPVGVRALRYCDMHRLHLLLLLLLLLLLSQVLRYVCAFIDR